MNIYDPLTRQQFSYNGQLNVIPPGRISQAGKVICSYVPPVAPTAGINNNYHSLSAPTWPYFNTYTPLIKVDHSFSDKEKLSVSYTMRFAIGCSQETQSGSPRHPPGEHSRRTRSMIISISLPIAGRSASISIPSSPRLSLTTSRFLPIVTSIGARMEPTGKAGTRNWGSQEICGRQRIFSGDYVQWRESIA